MKRNLAWITAGLCLLTGLGIYLFCRSHVLFLEVLGWQGEVLDTAQRPGMEMLVYNLPDGLWYMALLLIQGAYVRRESRLSQLLMGLSVVLPFLLEGLQAAGRVPGTADVNDLWAYVITLLTYLTIQFITMRKKNNLTLTMQAAVLLMFGAMALACASSTPTVTTSPVTKRATATSVDQAPAQYLYIGCFSTEEEAKSATQALGYSDYRYESGKCYAKIK